VSKDYLHLHIVRGFTGLESYLVLLPALRNLSLSRERQEAILGASPDAGSPADITWSGTPPVNAGEEIVTTRSISRYTRNGSARFSDLPIETIQSRETDPYVETRIEGRMSDETIGGRCPRSY